MKRTLLPPRRNYRRAFAASFDKGMNRRADKRVLPFDCATEAYNVCTDTGALTAGYGAVATDIPARFGKVFYYKRADDDGGEKGFYIAHDSASSKMYGGGSDPADWREIEGARFASAPSGVNYRLYGDDVFLLCGNEGMAVIDGLLRAVTVPGAPCVTSTAMHNERMFVTIGGRRNAVWFSDDLDPTNWNPELDEGGFIELEGESGRLNKVVDFGGYVYIFRDYGISRLAAYGDQSEFSIGNLFVSSGRIYGDTVAVCGDRILFAADDGIYSFDGLTAAVICRDLGTPVASGGATACFFGGRYYLASGAEGSVNDTLTVVDPRTKEAVVHKGMRITGFSPIVVPGGEKLLISSPDSGYLGKIALGVDWFGVKQKRAWRSGASDLGLPERTKMICDVYLDTEYDCTVTVTTERGCKRLLFKGKDAVQQKRVNLIGGKAGVAIEAEGDISVARLAVKYAPLSR